MGNLLSLHPTRPSPLQTTTRPSTTITTTTYRSMEEISVEWDKPTSKTFVMFASMIHVESFTSIKAKSDGTCAVISTNDGEVKVDEPGDYYVTRGESGLGIRSMTDEEVSKYTERLSRMDAHKLGTERAERKMAQDGDYS